MPRKTKDNIKKSNKKSRINTKTDMEKNTKEDKFSFDEEIVIGLKRIDEPVINTKVKRKANKYKKTKMKDNKKKQNKTDKTKGDDSTVIKSKYLENYEENNNRPNESKKKKYEKNKNVSRPLTKKEEIANQKKKIILKFTKWITLLAILAGGIIYAMLSPIFNITNIYVEGNLKISSETIISLSGLSINENIFKFRTSDIIDKIKENAYIDKVEIKRKFPDAVEINVYEREATFALEFGNGYAYINNQGYILEITDSNAEFPILEGYKTTTEEIKEGNRLIETDLENLGDVLKIMEAAKSVDANISDLITRIDISDNSNYILTLAKEKKKVYLGDTTNLSEKMLWIDKFLELEKKYEGTIYLNVNLNNETPYFREKI